MNKQSLQELRDTVANGKGHQVVGKIVAVFGPFEEPERGKSWLAYNAYNGSLDAAVDFLEAVLPGWKWSVNKFKDSECRAWTDEKNNLRRPGFIGVAATPARALLLATLDALIEGAE